MEESWQKITIPFKDDIHKEMIIAWLNALDIDALVEEDSWIEAFTNSNNASEIVLQLAEQVSLNIDQIEIVSVENKNWNALWEASFEPIIVEDVCVRATFHEKDAHCSQEIIIKPEMAFGTGHHETTFMMIQYMRKLDLTDKNVFDYGCGTGILAVYAAMQGARQISGIDIQPEAIENSWEHIDINGQAKNKFHFEMGDIALVKGKKFDLILANINRHVLLETASDLKAVLAPGGELICSGILKSDESLLIQHYQNVGFQLTYQNYRGEWCLFVFKESM